VPFLFGLVKVIEDGLPVVLVRKPLVTILTGVYPLMLVVTGLSK